MHGSSVTAHAHARVHRRIGITSQPQLSRSSKPDLGLPSITWESMYKEYYIEMVKFLG